MAESRRAQSHQSTGGGHGGQGRVTLLQSTQRGRARGGGAVTDKDRRGVEGNIMNCIKMSNTDKNMFYMKLWIWKSMIIYIKFDLVLDFVLSE